ncbi:MAG: dTDP-glucose 4,6-dehydratase [Gemmatimonadetes bacterium]|nr:dTDP-glucose 4,6-dehydratase [Gemmatimonadota bacterium]
MRLLVTGGAGFIGSNFVRYMLETHEDVEIVNLDALTYAGNLENLAGLEEDPRYRFVHGDICHAPLVAELVREAEAVANFAAESHVDRSIESDQPFIRTNVVGCQTLLAATLEAGGRRFVQISTDEVYGALPWRDPSVEAGEEDPGYFTEATPVAPRSPYSASKAAADHLVLAYFHTHGLDAIITRSSNNYGPYQFPEKLIPLFITNALEGKKLPLYGDGLYVRDWLHVRDHCRGVEAALLHGRAGELYNFGGRAERMNIQVARAILRHLGTGEDLIEHVPDRPGHDRRYAIDPSRAERDLGWRPRVSFEEGLAQTVDWYVENETWWGRVKSGAYREYYERMYGAGGRYGQVASRASRKEP